MGNFLEDIIERDIAENPGLKIVTRFPPEPNGYLHIGHAKSVLLNYGLAVKYGGKFNIRFDDTNPLKEDEEFVQSILRDVRWLGADGEVFYASDYFDVMYDCAVTLIKKNLAYVDDISPEQMRQERGTLTEGGTESKNRNRSIDESLRLFKDMKDGLVADGGLVLRAKIDMKSPNINMRDPIIYRVLKAAHHRQGSKWNIYPMYDFAHPIEDAVENITHSICTLEFEDHRPLYDWVLDNCGFYPRPRQFEFARLAVERTIMSKRYLKKLVDDGFVDGWDDPRMPTLAGIRRRGYTPSSLKEFCERIGVAKANSEVETAQLESCIREELNLAAERAMAVIDPVEVELVNVPDGFSEEIEFLHTMPEGEERKRLINFSKNLYIERADFSLSPPPKYKRLTVGGSVRLKSAYIITCDSADTDKDGNVTKIYARLIEGTKSGENYEGSVKPKGVIHFVAKPAAVPCEVRLYDYLLTDSDEKLDFSQRLNKDSLKVFKSFCEKRLETAEKGERFQFLRQGYFCRDIKCDGLVFNRIVELKDSFKPNA